MLFYKEESKEDDSKDLEKLQKQIDELTKENVALKKQTKNLPSKLITYKILIFLYSPKNIILQNKTIRKRNIINKGQPKLVVLFFYI